MTYAAIVAATVIVVLVAMAIIMRGRREAPAATSPAPRAAVGDWATFFTPRQYGEFVDEVRRALSDGGGAVTIRDDGVASRIESDGKPMEYGLQNLAQICRQLPRSDWSAFIAHHIETLNQSRKESADLEGMIDDLDKVKDLLAVRIGPREVAETGFAIAREDLPGTVSYLVLDLPRSVQTVHPDYISRWGRSVDELFRIGLQNVRDRYVPDVGEAELEKGLKLVAISAGDFFAATHVLMLDRYPQCVGAHGSLVAVPHRHAVLTYPISTADVVRAVHLLATMARAMEREGPGSISPRVYWYHDGRFTEIPVNLDDRRKTADVRPPAEFVQMLTALPAQSNSAG